MNYFSVVCFIWAAIGIGSRVIMGIMGERWKTWELNSAYAQKRPKAILIIAVLCLGLVGVTWYRVFKTDVPYSWVIAALVSLTTVKVGHLLFNYDGFRRFASETLNDKSKMLRLNIGVVVYSALLIGMGIWLY